MQTIVYGPAIIGTLGLYFSSLMINFFYLDKVWNLPIAIGTVVFLGVVIYGNKIRRYRSNDYDNREDDSNRINCCVRFWKGNSDILT